MAEQTKIAVGTSNEHKLEAVRAAAMRRKLNLDVISVKKAFSGIPGQPFGLDVIVVGATNRAVRALEATSAAEFGLGIESGIVAVGFTSYVDLAVVSLVRRADDLLMGHTAKIALSAGIPVPPQLVRASLESGQSKTVGQFLAEELGCASDDWQKEVTGGFVGRRAQVEEAVLIVLADLFPGPWRKSS